MSLCSDSVIVCGERGDSVWGGGRDESVRLWYQYRESNFKLYFLLPSN